LVTDREEFAMIALKLIALTIGAGALLVAFTDGFGQDLILAIIACLS
jgi:hypothetical protein